MATEILVEAIGELSPLMLTYATGVLTGAMAPTYYAQERLRGFGRSMFDKLPYKSPPGMEAEEAMLNATETPEEDNEADEAGEGRE